MKVKLVLGGEAVNIPHTSIGMGVTFVKVWLDGNGFTTASNDLGALGYILLETPTVDIGTLDPDRQRLFTHLHGRVVQFKIKPNIFAKDGGIARISLTVGVQDGGSVNEKTISFSAENCKGVSLVSNEINFSAEMLMMDDRVATNDKFIPDNDIAAAVNAAPRGQGQDQDQAVASNDSQSGQSDGQDEGAASQDQGQTASNDGSAGDQSQSTDSSQPDSQDQTVASQDSDSGSSDGQGQQETGASGDQDSQATADATSGNAQGQPDDQQDTETASQTDDSQVPA